ncbi:MAG: M15 family metallopeptidase [Bacteroidales bacterium]
MNKNIFKSGYKAILFILLLSAPLLIGGCGNQKSSDPKNPYGLYIINTTEAYQKSIVEDENNRLVDLQKYIPGIVLDIRYADTNNFTHTKIYSLPMAFLRKPAADSLLKIQKFLARQGLGLKIYDAYRPYSGTLYFYEVYPDTTFVAAPWKGSIHNRGCAVDLTLINLSTGEELEMPTLFDDFSEKASQNYIDLDSLKLANRATLLKIMTENGFTIYEHEWWHYNLKDRDKYKLMDISFEELTK